MSRPVVSQSGQDLVFSHSMSPFLTNDESGRYLLFVFVDVFLFTRPIIYLPERPVKG